MPKWGGRYIWQIKNAKEMLEITWEESNKLRELEKQYLDEFQKKYGKLPFANLRY